MLFYFSFLFFSLFRVPVKDYSLCGGLIHKPNMTFSSKEDYRSMLFFFYGIFFPHAEQTLWHHAPIFCFSAIGTRNHPVCSVIGGDRKQPLVEVGKLQDCGGSLSPKQGPKTSLQYLWDCLNHRLLKLPFSFSLCFSGADAWWWATHYEYKQRAKALITAHNAIFKTSN